ncbi:MAG: ABC transporter permease [Gammaproteobacteria bacterium]|nr:ABC transporter permease [Gammaproteobacteria bacterium]MCP5137162.1 ABC transporter permease [Gammaproteobacteria bacterium]
MPIANLAARSLHNRRFTALITVCSIALSVSLLLGVERLRNEAKSAFANTISGTDLILGARSGGVQLLLYSVFHIGNASNNIRWDSYEAIIKDPRVAWSVPLSLGDSHRGYRVVGTTAAFFKHYRYARDRSPELALGEVFDHPLEAVIGSEVARRLGYGPGTPIVLAHGAGEVSLTHHDDQPFTVVGVLAATGTPLDRSILVDLSGIEAIHEDWIGGRPVPGLHHHHASAAESEDEHDDEHTHHAGEPQTITAALIGLTAKVQTFQVQRAINDYRNEPLLAVMPQVALAELWQLMAVAENALRLISAMVVLVGLAGMATALVSGLEERRREMSILRAVGARPHQILTLIVGEAAFLTVTGMALGVGLLSGALVWLSPWLTSRYGLDPSLFSLSTDELALLAAILAAGLLVGLIPGYRAYRNSLSDGLTPRL